MLLMEGSLSKYKTKQMLSQYRAMQDTVNKDIFAKELEMEGGKLCLYTFAVYNLLYTAIFLGSHINWQ